MMFKVTFEFCDGMEVTVSQRLAEDVTSAHAAVNAAYAISMPTISALHNGLESVEVEVEDDE